MLAVAVAVAVVCARSLRRRRRRRYVFMALDEMLKVDPLSTLLLSLHYRIPPLHRDVAVMRRRSSPSIRVQSALPNPALSSYDLGLV